MEAVELFKIKLKDKGTVVIADTIFENDKVRLDIIKDLEDRNETVLAEELRKEFTSTKEELKDIFEVQGFNVSFVQLNKYVWILNAKLN